MWKYDLQLLLEPIMDTHLPDVICQSVMNTLPEQCPPGRPPVIFREVAGRQFRMKLFSESSGSCSPPAAVGAICQQAWAALVRPLGHDWLIGKNWESGSECMPAFWNNFTGNRG
ncbi:hypothetical protein A6X21_12385 [Planctopirus hydrillae]|uniref:Uncharacterized protein n=1 Tax=Planctopirus hydrillae TaxID=1841610 RepID=A0A1C3E5M5_9PLAN|nr:hypothetical protein A6X21_12385 [Planctopirus hydrillae]